MISFSFFFCLFRKIYHQCLKTWTRLKNGKANGDEISMKDRDRRQRETQPYSFQLLLRIRYVLVNVVVTMEERHSMYICVSVFTSYY